jgi:hypothetical protein
MNRATTLVIVVLYASQWIACKDGGNDSTNFLTGANSGTIAAGGVSGNAGKSGEQAGTGSKRLVDRSTLTNVGTTGPLDYANPGMWACLPNTEPNICDSNLDATSIKSDGAKEAAVHLRAENPQLDCFYVYPTVLLTGAPQMVDFSEAGMKIVADPLLSQGARFSRICQIYAPLYRQVGLVSGDAGVTIAPGADSKLGLQDVRDAFAYYLKNYNGGRKFVLIGHSQGSRMLTELMKLDVDPEEKAEVRTRMLSALIIGSSVLVPKGDKIGGTFTKVPLCSNPGEIGCVITYASFASDKPPTAGARFAMTAEEGKEVGCTNPATLSGNTGKYSGSYFPANVSNSSFKADTLPPADLATPFALYRDYFKGACVNKNGANYLEITADSSGTQDKRTPPWRFTSLESTGWGLHLVDYDIPMDDLIEAVRLQAAKAGQL